MLDGVKLGTSTVQASISRFAWPRELATRAVRTAVLLGSLVITTVVSVALLATVLGYDLFVIDGGSMAPSVPAGALLISDRVSPASLEVGDVITFRRSSAPESPVTHRVIRIESGAAGPELWTKGDANQTADPQPLTGSDPVSVMRVSLPMAGYLLGFLRTLPGQLALIVAPLAFLLLRLIRQPYEASRSHESGGAPEATRPTEVSPRRTLTVPALPPVLVPGRLRIAAAGAFGRLGSLGGVRSVSVPRPSLRLARRATAPVSPTPRSARMLAAAVEPARLSADLAETLRVALDPVQGLAESLQQRTRAFEAELTRSLQPMTEYADQLEQNLGRLVLRLGEAALAPGTPVARQVSAERERLESVRAAIEEAKEPLRAMLRREASAVDAVLAPFEPDIESFEVLLRQQRRHLVRVVSGLQSEPFHDALDALRRRSDSLRTLAALGETDPTEVGTVLEMDALGETEQAMSPYLVAAIAALTADADPGDLSSDQRPSSAA